MKVYVFGNECVAADRRAVEVARVLEDTMEGISFVFVNPNEDVATEHVPSRMFAKTVMVLAGDEMVMLVLPAPYHVNPAKAG